MEFLGRMLVSLMVIFSFPTLAYQPSTTLIKVSSAYSMPANDEWMGDTKLGGSITYMATAHLGIELFAALPLKYGYAVPGGGQGGVQVRVLGELSGEMKGGMKGKAAHVPLTLSLHYYPLWARSDFQPYFGVGVNYAFFTHAQGDLKEMGRGLKAVFGPAWSVGFNYDVDDYWTMSIAYADLDVKTQTKLSKRTLIINPTLGIFSLGYRFP